MSYETAFAAAGAEVIWCEYFGDYQGRLLAKIIAPGKAEPEYILDYFGSCSVCDSFAADMSDFSERDDPEVYSRALASFGEPYVTGALSFEEALERLSPKPGQWRDAEDDALLAKLLEDRPDARKPSMFTIG